MSTRSFDLFIYLLVKNVVEIDFIKMCTDNTNCLIKISLLLEKV